MSTATANAADCNSTLPQPCSPMPSCRADQPTSEDATVETAMVTQYGTTESDEDPGVQELAQEGVLLPVGQLPDRAQTVPHRADPADAGEQQDGARDEPDGAGVLDQCVDVELVGDARHLLGDLVLKLLCCWPARVAAAIAAPTVSSGKSATKLMKVIAAASRVHFTRSRRSYDRHPWVAIRRVTNGPTPGSFFSQSMIRLCPHLGKPMSGYPETQDRGECHTYPRTGDRVGASRGEPEAIVADGDAQELDEGAREVHGEEREEVGVPPGPPHGVCRYVPSALPVYATEQPATNDSALAVSRSRPTGPRSQRKRPRSAA